MIVAILNQKGGAGKTTISTNLARKFTLEGFKTLLVDSDPQGSARNWHHQSDGAYINLIALDRPTIKKDIFKFDQHYDIIFIDGAPLLSDMASSSIFCADIVLIPVQPSPYDVWSTEDIINLVEQKRNATDKTEVAFILSRKITKSVIARDVIDLLNQFNIPVFKSGTFQRVSYCESALEGKSVLEWNDDQAKKDITSIYEELKDFINEKNLKLGKA